MVDSVVPTVAAPERIARLERRLERERSAREEAELIAERRMRELWLANQELDARVEERTADLSGALADLERASHARDAFLEWLSHETRTPLNGVLGMLELLEAYVDAGQGASYLGQATISARQLHRTLRRLIAWVELESDRLELAGQVLRVSDLATRLSDAWRKTLLARSQLLSIVTLGPDTPLRLDVDHLAVVADELLANIEAHAKPGLVTVTLTRVEDGMTAELVDPGPAGASEPDPTFELGLQLVRSLVAEMGGELELCLGADKGVARMWLPSIESPASAD